MSKILFVILFICKVFLSQAQDLPINVLFVLDGSSSMLKSWGKQDKWTIAEESLIKIADSLLSQHKNLQFGLRVYGHQSLPIKNDCEDTELKLPIAKNTLDELRDKLISVKPKGITPLSYTLEQTKSDFLGLEKQKNILILITDGSESCIGDPCDILQILLDKEVIVKPVIIGLDIDIESLKEYNCITDVFNPHTAIEFQRDIMKIVSQAINFTTCQINLIDENNKPIQTNIPMLLYSSDITPDYTFYHRLDTKNNVDTLLIEPSPLYTLHIQTIPPIIRENIKLKANRHNIISINAPTCNLSINSYDDEEAVTLIPEIPYFIKSLNNTDYCYGSSTNTKQEYLFGTYDIDILTLPVTQIKNIILNSNTKEIKIPCPGKLVVNAKFPIHAALFTEINNRLVNIYTFPANSKQEILDLQPGNYSLVYRFDHKRDMTESVIENIQIKSKEILELKF
jgi:Ca-activated chloride channel family protein